MVKTTRQPRFMISVVRGKTRGGLETDCIGCAGCEAICSFSKENEVNPELSRIRVVSQAQEWIKGNSGSIVLHTVCRQCPGIAPCMKACQVNGALRRDEHLGTILIDYSKCTGCQECVKSCPYEAVWYSKQKRKIIKCDLCYGSPKCVEWCPVGVLKLVKIS